MATKRIETQLTIKAVDQYSSMLRNMRTVTGRFADGVRTEMSRLQDLRGPLRLIEDFRKQQDVVRRSGVAMEAAREKQRRLLAEIRATRNPTAQMRREFERARATADRLEQQHQQNRRALFGLQGQLRQAGVNTGDLAGEQRRLAGALDGATTAFGRQMERMRLLETMQTRIAEARERMDRSLATAANLSFVGNASMMTGRRIMTALSGPVQQAIDFESAMSDVRKVVDFDTPESFAQMSDDILELSTRIPMAADGLAQIVAAGAQAGFEQEDLLAYAEAAAKVGVAFDISAERAGTGMAGIQTQLRLSLEDTTVLFDAMNHLSNNMNSTGSALLDFTNSGLLATAQGYGFAASEALAFGSAMIAAGTGPDVAATSFRNMGRALTKGASMSDRQREAMARLGLESEDVARRMQEDAAGTTIDVLERISRLSAELQPSLISDLFGDEARALAPLLEDVDLLREALGLVSDEQQYLGSAEREYAARAETTANNLQLMRNQMARLGIGIGEVVLPPLNDLLEMSQGAIDRMVAWTKEHPKLTKWLVIGAAAVGGLAIAGGALLTAAAGLIGTMAVLRFGLVGLGARAIFAGGNIASLAGRFGLLRRLPRFRLASLVTPIRWAAGLIPSIRWTSLAGGLRWTSLIRPLSWLGRGALRFIPVIGWATLAGELLWRFLIKPLGWDEYLPSIDWQRIWGAFSWEGWLPKVNWSEFLAAIDWPDWIDNLSWSSFVPDIDWSYWFSFDWVDHLPQWSWDFIPVLNIRSKIVGFGSGWANSIEDGSILGRTVPSEDVGSNTYIPPSARTPSYLPGMPESFRSGLAGERATGGPVRAGFPYLVNENTPRSEIFVPSQSGGILNVGQAQAAFRSHLSGMAPRPVGRNPELARLHRGAQGLRAASLAVLTSSALAAPAAAQGVSGAVPKGNVRVEINGGINIQVPSGVSDPDAIADLVSDRIGQRVAATMSASFSD